MCPMKENIAHLQKKDQDISQNDAFAIKDVMHLPQVTSGSNKQSQYGCCAVLLWVTHAEGHLWPLHCTLHIFSIFLIVLIIIPSLHTNCYAKVQKGTNKTTLTKKVSASGEKKQCNHAHRFMLMYYVT